MFTFLHHSDPTLPHYRKNSWTFLRGAAATVDRPLLGWVGRFFMHNISHDHIAHRESRQNSFFFTTLPFFPPGTSIHETCLPPFPPTLAHVLV